MTDIKLTYNFSYSLRTIRKFAEVLQDPTIQVKLSDTKAATEVKALEQFYQILQVEPAKAYYGKNHVVKAAESQAIETLLISDNLFRYVQSSNFVEFATYVFIGVLT